MRIYVHTRTSTGSQCHPTQVNAPHLNPCQTSQYLVYLSQEGWKAEFTLALVILEWFTCLPTVTHLSRNHLIVT